MLEFTFALLPLVVMTFVLLDIAWAIFVKSTMAYAVRAGLRVGITATGTQAKTAGAGGTASDLTTMVKTAVQNNSLGLLKGATGLAKIKVHYFQPPAVNSTAGLTDVSGLNPGGNTPLNVMQVSVQGFSLSPLIPRIFSWNQAPDNASTTINAVSADLIEPSRDVPPIGAAP
jgi:Flp pilus assembly protein TadG